MAYTVFELSEELGLPIEIYEFTVGDSAEVYRHTSADNDVEYLGDVYTAIPIERDSIQLDPSQSLRIKAHKNFPVAVKLQGFPDGILIHLSVRRIHSGDDDIIITWRGRVKSASFKGVQAEITCDPKLKSLKKSAFRTTFGNTCSHILYSPQCGVDKEDFKTEALVSSAAGAITDKTFAVLSPTIAPILPDGWLKGGYAKRVSNGDVRMILSNIQEYTIGTQEIELLAPFQSLEVGEAVELYAGCDLSFTMCRDKFFPAGDPGNAHGNTENIGAFPFVPTKNPFDSDIN